MGQKVVGRVFSGFCWAFNSVLVPVVHVLSCLRQMGCMLAFQPNHLYTAHSQAHAWQQHVRGGRGHTHNLPDCCPEGRKQQTQQIDLVVRLMGHLLPLGSAQEHWRCGTWPAYVAQCKHAGVCMCQCVFVETPRR